MLNFDIEQITNFPLRGNRETAKCESYIFQNRLCSENSGNFADVSMADGKNLHFSIEMSVKFSDFTLKLYLHYFNGYVSHT